MRRFGEGPPQPGRPMPGFTPAPVPGALVVAWTHAGPRGEMLGLFKGLEIRAYFRHDDFGHAPTNARQTIPHRHLRFKRADLVLNLLVKAFDSLVQVVNMAQVLR